MSESECMIGLDAIVIRFGELSLIWNSTSHGLIKEKYCPSLILYINRVEPALESEIEQSS